MKWNKFPDDIPPPRPIIVFQPADTVSHSIKTLVFGINDVKDSDPFWWMELPDEFEEYIDLYD